MQELYKQILGVKNTQEIIDVLRHGSGRLYLWEDAYINDGVTRSTVISNRYKEKKRPLFVKTPYKSYGRYAAIPVQEGDYVTKVRCDYNFDMSVAIYRIDSIITDNKGRRHYGILTEVDSFIDGVWRSKAHLDFDCELKRAFIQATPLRDKTIHTKKWVKNHTHEPKELVASNT